VFVYKSESVAILMTYVVKKEDHCSEYEVNGNVFLLQFFIVVTRMALQRCTY